MTVTLLNRISAVSQLQHSRWGLVLAPILGGLFVLAFPILVMAAATWGVLSRLALFADRQAWLAESRYQPAVAWLKGSASTAAGLPVELTDLAREVALRRQAE